MQKIDDTILYVPMFSKICTRCAHFDVDSPFGEKKTCTAFPSGIPAEIWLGENDHSKPFPGDNGIQFQLHPDAKAKGDA